MTQKPNDLQKADSQNKVTAQSAQPMRRRDRRHSKSSSTGRHHRTSHSRQVAFPSTHVNDNTPLPNLYFGPLAAHRGNTAPVGQPSTATPAETASSANAPASAAATPETTASVPVPGANPAPTASTPSDNPSATAPGSMATPEPNPAPTAGSSAAAPAAQMPAGFAGPLPEAVQTDPSTRNKPEGQAAREDLSASSHHHTHSGSRSSHHSSQHRHHSGSRVTLVTSKKKPKKRGLRNTLLVLACVVLVAVITFCSLQLIGRYRLLNYQGVEVIPPDTLDAAVDDQSDSILYNGQTYVLNQNITNILCLGVDRQELGTDKTGTGGQADAVYLVSVNTQTGVTVITNISRDTMVDVNINSASGALIRTEHTQLCLSFSYGDGKVTSCQNTVASVERLLYGLPVNSYVALDVAGIGAMTDAVGGLTVQAIDSELRLTDGTMHLTSANAETYVRKRNTNYLTSNNDRMARQMEFLKAFTSKAISMTKADLRTPLNLYNIATQYMVTDLDASKVVYLATSVVQKAADKITFQTLPGQVVLGEDGYAEYHMDDEAWFQMYLDTFYTVVQ